MTDHFDEQGRVLLFTREFAACPQQVYEQLRSRCPVARAAPFDQPVLSRHEDVRNVNRNTEVFLSVGGPSLGSGGTGLMLVDMDGARHVRQRKLISAGFTPRMTARLEEKARRWAVSIVEQALERETSERGTFLDEACGDDPALRTRVASATPVAEARLRPVHDPIVPRTDRHGRSRIQHLAFLQRLASPRHRPSHQEPSQAAPQRQAAWLRRLLGRGSAR